MSAPVKQGSGTRKRFGRLTVVLTAAPDESTVKALLKASALPFTDITPKHLRHFLGCRAAGRLVGMVGLEPRGNVAL